MRELTINDVRVTALTRPEVDQYHLRNTAQHLAEGIYLAKPLTSRETLQAAGRDLSKIDFAVPLSWWRRICSDPDTGATRYVAIHNPDSYVWSYEDGSLFGGPLSIDEVYHTVRELIFAALVEGDDE